MTKTQQTIDIRTREAAISVVKPSGTQVDYYLYPEFELHANTLPAGIVQDWHRHVKLEEVVLVTSGSLLVDYIENEQVLSQLVHEGDVLRVKTSIHRLSNPTNQTTQFTVFRFIPTGNDQTQVMKTDKIDCENWVADQIK